MRLKYTRKELRNLTQEQLSEKTGVPATSISKFEDPSSLRKYYKFS
jgi:transcriptional regulator with XRE-family HTH domain